MHTCASKDPSRWSNHEIASRYRRHAGARGAASTHSGVPGESVTAAYPARSRAHRASALTELLLSYLFTHRLSYSPGVARRLAQRCAAPGRARHTPPRLGVGVRVRVGARVRVRVRVRARVGARVRIRIGCAAHLHGTVHAASDHRSIGRGGDDIRLQGQRPRVVVGHAWRVGSK
eukprot:scaffold48125_cov58-Phaeocystis_antarctica.AAC.2